MFKSIYYANTCDDNDDQQRVSTVNSDSAYYIEFEELNEYMRVGVQDTDDAGQPLPETWVSLEIGKSFRHPAGREDDPLWWGGTLTQFRELMKRIDNTEETNAHQDRTSRV